MLAIPLAAEYGLEIIFLQDSEFFDSRKDRQMASARMNAEYLGFIHNLNPNVCNPENHLWNLLKRYDAHPILTALITCRMAREKSWAMTASLQNSIARSLGLPSSTFGEISKRWVHDAATAKAQQTFASATTYQLCRQNLPTA